MGQVILFLNLPTEPPPLLILWHSTYTFSNKALSCYIDGKLVTTKTLSGSSLSTTAIKGGGSFVLAQEQDTPLITTDAAGNPPNLDPSLF